MTQAIREQVMNASRQWIQDFNQGNTQACIARYLPQAQLQVSPFGRFAGIEAIAGFWQDFAGHRPGDLIYRNVDIKVLDDSQAILSANWRMNIASGFITKELWIKAADGQWYLAEDDFSVLAQHAQPLTQRTALVIVDMQNDYFDGGRFPLADTEAAAAKTLILLEQFRRQGKPVIHVQHIFEDPEAGFFAPGTQGSEIYPALAPQEDETLVVKHRVDSFTHTQLEQVLVTLGIDELVVTGAMAHVCIQSMTRSAIEKGYGVTVIADAIAAPTLSLGGVSLTAPQVIAANLCSLAFGMAELKTANEWLQAHA
ncbi:cysteine hydrolase family protein [Shewanella salipaludis]|uniref:Isochorismatase family protein n=1 Tax=Shewanella salipaludis TaxID=2723052 RepID=A0A972FSX1_9GAMM|nr:isochorismatase family protein [Shewanella salipaludis]NMH65112.1 isochorismatase family protein [Shewanella salipaludis]